VLELSTGDDGNCYLISNVEWFCQILNHLFNQQSDSIRDENLTAQLKNTIGDRAHITSKRAMGSLGINTNEVIHRSIRSRLLHLSGCANNVDSLLSMVFERMESGLFAGDA
jgi:hypothetical protein